jgi:3-hydroxyisobutyrate dehydrogenase-like beta-hydroxyacid dehydrogenase
MKKFTVGFLGFGKAASIFVEDLNEAGLNCITVYDKNWDVEPYNAAIMQNAEKLSARIVCSPSELASRAMMVISMVTPASSEEAARNIVPYLSDNSFFIDMNSSSPMTKRRCYDYISAINPTIHYLDGCILGAVSEKRIRTPVLLCGQSANQAKEFLNSYGANIEVVEGLPGSASAVKMIRSVFMKGIEVLLIEALHAARAYNIQSQFVDTIKDTFETLTFNQLINMLVTTHAIHGKRRQGEMQEVIDTLKAQNVDAKMSESTLEKFRWSTEFALAEFFHNMLPNEYDSVIEAIYTKSRAIE